MTDIEQQARELHSRGRKWRPFLRAELARTPGDRHWWVDTNNGLRVHQWLGAQTTEDRDGALIFTVIAGPLLFVLAARPQAVK